MDKSEIINCICEVLVKDLATIQAAYQDSHESATHAESVAENKYDTRGLEAAYLAHGQAKRAEEIEISLHAYQAVPKSRLEAPHSQVGIASLVLLVDQDEQQRWCWIGADSGGLKFSYEGKTISIVTPQSPLGAMLMEREVGDGFELSVNGNLMEYEIVELY